MREPMHWEGSSVVNGRLVSVDSDSCPRLLGDACGCVRVETQRGWLLTLCSRHGEEVAKYPERLW